MEARIFERSASVMVHHGRWRVTQLVPVEWAGTSGGGLAVYVHVPVGRAGVCFPNIYWQRLLRRECIKVRDN